MVVCTTYEGVLGPRGKVFWVLLTCGGRGAGLAGLVPGLAHVVGTATHLLGHVEGQLVLARVVEVAVAHALAHVCGRTESGSSQEQ